MTQRHIAGHRTQTIPRHQPQSVLKAHGRSWPWLGRSCQNFQGRTGTQIQKSLVLEKGKRLPMEQKSLAASHQARTNTKAPSLHHHASGPQVTLPTSSHLGQRDQSFQCHSWSFLGKYFTPSPKDDLQPTLRFQQNHYLCMTRVWGFRIF